MVCFIWVIGMLIKTVVKNESNRNEEMIRAYEALLSDLPKGSLTCRKKEYYYLKYRENGRVCDKYVGKDKDVITDLRHKLELRRHYTDMLSSLKREQKTIRKILEDLA